MKKEEKRIPRESSTHKIEHKKILKDREILKENLYRAITITEIL
jgi:hypothetical protein